MSILNRAVFITKCEGMWSLARHVAENQPPFCSLPASACRLVYKALVLAGAGVAEDHRVKFWELVSRVLCKYRILHEGLLYIKHI